MGLIKDIYSPEFYNRFADTVKTVWPSFDRQGFMSIIFGDEFEHKEWKERMKHTTRIAKDHPEIVIGLAAGWKGISKETDAIIKHGCRTLLKQGHAEVLKHYGLSAENIILQSFSILSPEVSIGGNLEFTFMINNQNISNRTVRLEYGIYYKKAKGHLAKKVFKISEKVYQPGAMATINRRQSFKLITTRQFYTGKHQLSVIINGEESERLNFVVID